MKVYLDDSLNNETVQNVDRIKFYGNTAQLIRLSGNDAQVEVDKIVKIEIDYLDDKKEMVEKTESIINKYQNLLGDKISEFAKKYNLPQKKVKSIMEEGWGLAVEMYDELVKEDDN